MNTITNKIQWWAEVVLKSFMLLKTIQVITGLYVVTLTLLLELPMEPLPDNLSAGWGLKGNEHVLAFTLLGLLAELCRRKMPMVLWVGGLLCYSFTTEILQGLLNPICHRIFDWEDCTHNIFGVFLGTLFAYYGLAPFVRAVAQNRLHRK